ncbi:hypothetical protein [Trichocoleus sp. DQ-U1]|uniref:hypothetical protein n=1 Tax=Trichocoleus sp. DQ-U1 TaxID=2933926 RepID=UPI0032987270
MQKPIRSISASTASNLPLTPPVEPFGSGYTGSNQNSFDSQGILSRTPTQGESVTHPGKIQRQCDRSFAEIYGGATGSIEMSVQPTSTETASIKFISRLPLLQRLEPTNGLPRCRRCLTSHLPRFLAS